LSRMTLSETAAYIQHRLRVAGAVECALFSNEALTTIYEMSGGIPRLVNQLCDDALHTAARNGIVQVDARIIMKLIDNGDVMRAPALPQKNVAPKIVSPKIEANTETAAVHQPEKEQPQHNKQRKPLRSQRRIIQTEYDLFEAIDLSELLSVI